MIEDVEKIRNLFPILSRKVYGKPLVYFDNAATTQKPWQVIDRITKYYSYENCNIHRGVHFLSQEATEEFENTRELVKNFINAGKKEEVIFTKGTTEGINLIANSLGEILLLKDDEVIISALEHHSNIVPWQMICEKKGAKLRVIDIDDKGEIILEEYKKLLNKKTRIVAIGHVSNALGTINPVNEIISEAHKHDIPVVVDGAQGASHLEVDVRDLDCDFYCFSGHKIYGPMGSGVLYGKEKWLEKMPPYQGGGEMVDQVSFEKTTYNELPFKFEAGTPNVEGILGLKEALNFVNEISIRNIAKHEDELLKYGTEKLLEIDGVRIIGTSDHKAGIISFLMGDIHPYDAGMIIDKFGVAVRTGHHCAQPVMDWFGIPGTIRASFAIYNTKEEIDILIEAVKKAKEMLT